jgi:hypothetical protein
VFWILKLVNFISFAYELQIGWFKLQNIHNVILYFFLNYFHSLFACLNFVARLYVNLM